MYMIIIPVCWGHWDTINQIDYGLNRAGLTRHTEQVRSKTDLTEKIKLKNIKFLDFCIFMQEKNHKTDISRNPYGGMVRRKILEGFNMKKFGNLF